MENVTAVLKNMSLALFFSGCNHYKSIHFAVAKIHIKNQIEEKIVLLQHKNRNRNAFHSDSERH